MMHATLCRDGMQVAVGFRRAGGTYLTGNSAYEATPLKLHILHTCIDRICDAKHCGEATCDEIQPR